MSKKSFIADFVAAVKSSKDANGESHIKSKDLAKLIKFKLGQKFPGVKFSVKSDFNAIDVSYDNGPPSSMVGDFVHQFQFGGFDGMIDMSYSSKNWLLEDGSMVPASSSGTQGSMGVYAAYYTDCPVPGAVLVSCYVKYVHAQNSLSDDFWNLLCNATAFKYGHKIVGKDKSRLDEYVESKDEYLSTLVWKFYGDTFRAGGDAALADPNNYVANECHKLLAAEVLEQVADDLEDKAIDDLVDEYIAESWL